MTASSDYLVFVHVGYHIQEGEFVVVGLNDATDLVYMEIQIKKAVRTCLDY